MFDADGGTEVSVETLAAELQAARDAHDIEGLTVVGGEPLQQLPGVTALAAAAQRLQLGVLVFTGLTTRRALARPGFAELWRQLDTLVAEPFVRDAPEPETARRFIGSTNQRRWHRTPRYRAAALWRGPAEAELHFDADGQPRVIGAPRATAPLVAALRRRVG
jgi:anaerobic ribonucleoside-triphosphate reductase activating protein